MSALEAKAEVEVGFYDTDPMEVAWHGNYLKYFEVGRCALLRRIDYDYPQMRASGYFWPIVDCRLKYVAPARYGQRLVVRAALREWEHRLRIDYRIEDAATAKKVTTGYTIQVAVAITTGELQFLSPPVLLEKLERAWRA
ncbi:MAG TPA: thioesterase family protein [Burkholderiales bacterium]|nr:thioesterase family protein [Burkholderiales bacterium]